MYSLIKFHFSWAESQSKDGTESESKTGGNGRVGGLIRYIRPNGGRNAAEML